MPSQNTISDSSWSRVKIRCNPFALTLAPLVWPARIKVAFSTGIIVAWGRKDLIMATMTTTVSGVFDAATFFGKTGGMTIGGAEIVVPSLSCRGTPPTVQAVELVEGQRHKAMMKISSLENQILGFECRIARLLEQSQAKDEQLQAKDDRIAEQRTAIQKMTTGACRELFGIEFIVKPCDDHWVWEVFNADGYSTTFGNAATEVEAVAMALMAY